MIAASLRDARASLLADTSLRGVGFGEALADVLDRTLRELFDDVGGKTRVALVALGSYARRELCPGSDIDVLLLHDAKGRALPAVRDLAERIWYPLWDAGFVTGHGTRTVKDSMALADEDIDALTAFLDAHHIAGNEELTDELVTRGRQLAQRRSRRLLTQLAEASALRRVRPGLVAEMLEPDLKDGGGGLRDIQSLAWAGDALGAPGLLGLEARGFLTEPDAPRLAAARALLLDLRVALHRVTGGRSDRLALQEQVAVAALVRAGDGEGPDSDAPADAMVRQLSTLAREVAWVSQDVWSRVRDHLDGPSNRVAHRDRVLAEAVVLREGRVIVTEEPPVSALRVLEAAAAAAEVDAPFERATLLRLRSMSDPTWDVWERAAFLRLLRAGAGAIPVFEALDHEDVLVRILPEWEHVRSRPQRNAYHRFTVDRHLLEALAICAELLDAGDATDPGFDGVVARACRRPELLLLGALLHDIGKGLPADHSDAGATIASQVARRIGLDSEGREIVTWLVRNHLLMAEIATRRDLSDASVADNLAAACAGDAERLRLLYLLTIGDSRATGPAAWGATKGVLLRDLFVKAAAAIERGKATAIAEDRRELLTERLGAESAAAFLDRMPAAYLLAFPVEEITEHAALLGADRTHTELRERAAAIQCRLAPGHVSVTVVAQDRPRLLATLAGALTVCGLDVVDANLFGTADGLAFDVFRATDPYGRVVDGGENVAQTLQQALDSELDVEKRVADRRRDYARRGATPGPVEVRIVADESDTDTLVEVHADDEIGLLYRLAATFADLGLDVRVAKVATQGDRVVDVFYVRDAAGAKIDDPELIEKVHSALVTRLSQ
jgi:[protein-PII] uridylyltransferase